MMHSSKPSRNYQSTTNNESNKSVVIVVAGIVLVILVLVYFAIQHILTHTADVQRRQEQQELLPTQLQPNEKQNQQQQIIGEEQGINYLKSGQSAYQVEFDPQELIRLKQQQKQKHT